MPTPKSKKHVQTIEIMSGQVLHTLNVYKSRRKMLTYTLTISYSKDTVAGKYVVKTSKGPFATLEDAVEKAYQIINEKSGT
jgi:hypothetical protein